MSFDQWPYNSKPVIVLSRNPIAIPARLSPTVTHSSELPKKLYDRLSTEGAKHLYIDGGVTLQRFLAEDLIDDLTITVLPILLGSGLPLFGYFNQDIQLQHIATRTYEFGFVQSTYAVVKEKSSNECTRKNKLH